MSAYSKEPWEVRNEHIAEHVESKPFCCDIGLKDRGNFAYVQAYPEDSKWGTSNEEAKANARLIAAAPELLEALEYAAALIGGIAKIAPEISGPTMTAKNKDTGEKHPTSFLQIVDAVTSAIAKAKGETP